MQRSELSGPGVNYFYYNTPNLILVDKIKFELQDFVLCEPDAVYNEVAVAVRPDEEKVLVLKRVLKQMSKYSYSNKTGYIEYYPDDQLVMLAIAREKGKKFIPQFQTTLHTFKFKGGDAFYIHNDSDRAIKAKLKFIVLENYEVNGLVNQEIKFEVKPKSGVLAKAMLIDVLASAKMEYSFGIGGTHSHHN